jgi:hypothetical protein
VKSEEEKLVFIMSSTKNLLVFIVDGASGQVSTSPPHHIPGPHPCLWLCIYVPRRTACLPIGVCTTRVREQPLSCSLLAARRVHKVCASIFLSFAITLLHCSPSPDETTAPSLSSYSLHASPTAPFPPAEPCDAAALLSTTRRGRAHGGAVE